MRSRKSSTASPSAVAPPGAAAGIVQLPLGFDRPGLIAGVDEAGRGPLAGPVVAAAVILDELQPIAGLNDSKKLSPKRREALFDEIRAKALACCIAEASVEEIDRLNILHATMLAMRRAVEGLRLKPGKVLVDGNRVPVLRIPAEAIVGGDATVQAISAASILAKVHRDRLCLALHEAHPRYGFAVHKGYPTAAHVQALRTHGPCAEHRRSYAPVREAALAVGALASARTDASGAAAAHHASTDTSTETSTETSTGTSTGTSTNTSGDASRDAAMSAPPSAGGGATTVRP